MKTVLYKNKSIEPRKSDVHGWGIFTKEKISKGEILEECHCLYMTEDDASYTHHLKPIRINTIRVEDRMVHFLMLFLLVMGRCLIHLSTQM